MTLFNATTFQSFNASKVSTFQHLPRVSGPVKLTDGAQFLIQLKCNKHVRALIEMQLAGHQYLNFGCHIGGDRKSGIVCHQHLSASSPSLFRGTANNAKLLKRSHSTTLLGKGLSLMRDFNGSRRSSSIPETLADSAQAQPLYCSWHPHP